MGVSVIRSPAGHYVYPWFALWFSGSPSEYELQAIRALFAYVLACSYLTSCGIRSGTTAFSLYSLALLEGLYWFNEPVLLGGRLEFCRI